MLSRPLIVFLSLLFFCLTVKTQNATSTTLSGGDEATEQSKTDPDPLSEQIKTYETILSKLEQNASDSPSKTPLLIKLGQLYFTTQDYPKSIMAYLRSIVLSKNNLLASDAHSLNIAWQVIEIGNSMYRLEDYENAEYAFNISRSIFSSTHDTAGAITAINNIGLCKLKSKDPQGALPVFTSTLKLSQLLKDSSRIYISRIYISMCYAGQADYDKAISLLKDRAMIAMMSENSGLNLFRLEQLGEYFYQSNSIDSAVSVYKKMSSLQETADNASYIILARIKLAGHYQKTDDFGLAMQYATLAYKSLDTLNDNSLKKSVHEILYSLNKKTGKFKEALFHYESFQHYKELIDKMQLENFIEDYNAKSEIIAARVEVEKLAQQKNQAEEEKTYQKNMSVFMVVITLLLLVMLITGKGFEPRIQFLEEFITDLSTRLRVLISAVLLIYCIGFFYFFLPIDHVLDIHRLGLFMRLVPGGLSFAVTILVIIVFFAYQRKMKAETNKYRSYLYLFIAICIAVFLVEWGYFSLFSFTSLNFILSLALIVLASFVVPLYLLLLAVERLIIKRFEVLSKELTHDISQIKKNIAPSEEVITIQSEKTSGKISFNLIDFVAVEAQGNYCMFYVIRKQVITRKLLHTTMKALEAQLTEHPNIIRCHKSFLVNIHQITRVSGNSRGYVLHFSGDIEPIPVSRGYQKDVMAIIRQFREEIS